MLDRWTLKLCSPVLHHTAILLHRTGVTATGITVLGFAFGMLSVPLLAYKLYIPALVVILFNRIADGLDGQLARLGSPTDRGAFLDITLDFIFYGAVPLGFALADPGQNGLAATVLIFSFIASGSSFLAFGIMAAKNGLTSDLYPHKGFYYLAGLAEGTETILFFCLFFLLPSFFPVLAYIFSFFCLLSAAIRVIGSCKILD